MAFTFEFTTPAGEGKGCFTFSFLFYRRANFPFSESVLDRWSYYYFPFAPFAFSSACLLLVERVSVAGGIFYSTPTTTKEELAHGSRVV
jgi:hypothetical protein